MAQWVWEHTLKSWGPEFKYWESKWNKKKKKKAAMLKLVGSPTQADPESLLASQLGQMDCFQFWEKPCLKAMRQIFLLPWLWVHALHTHMCPHNHAHAHRHSLPHKNQKGRDNLTQGLKNKRWKNFKCMSVWGKNRKWAGISCVVGGQHVNVQEALDWLRSTS